MRGRATFATRRKWKPFAACGMGWAVKGYLRLSLLRKARSELGTRDGTCRGGRVSPEGQGETRLRSLRGSWFSCSAAAGSTPTVVLRGGVTRANELTPASSLFHRKPNSNRPNSSRRCVSCSLVCTRRAAYACCIALRSSLRARAHGLTFNPRRCRSLTVRFARYHLAPLLLQEQCDR